jgi:hypothetical protein
VFDRERERLMAKSTTKTVGPAAKKNQRSAIKAWRTRILEIRQLRAIVKETITERERFRDRAVLAAVYALYRSWLAARQSRDNARRICNIFRLKVRRNVHPTAVILAATLPRLDKKIRSKWSLALQYASQNDVPPEDLSSFMDQNDGMAGCAQRFARLNKTKHGVSKTKKRVAAKKK